MNKAHLTCTVAAILAFAASVQASAQEARTVRVSSVNPIYQTVTEAQQQCNQSPGNQTAGTLIGGGIGALIGNAVSSRHDKAVGSLAGAAIGAGAGNIATQSSGTISCVPVQVQRQVVIGYTTTYSFTLGVPAGSQPLPVGTDVNPNDIAVLFAAVLPAPPAPVQCTKAANKR